MNTCVVNVHTLTEVSDSNIKNIVCEKLIKAQGNNQTAIKIMIMIS